MENELIDFVEMVAKVWREDYQIKWKDAHRAKWNRCLVLLGADRKKYGIPDEIVGMSIEEVRRKAGKWPFSRWAKVKRMYEKYKKEIELKRVEIIEDDFAKTPEKIEEEEIERIEKIDDEAEKIDEIVKSEVVNDRIPVIRYDVIKKQTEANEVQDLLIKYCYIEDWGREYKRTPEMGYREWIRVKLYGGYDLNENAPEWLVNAWRLLKDWYADKGYAWQSIRSHVRDSCSGSHRLHRGKGIEDVEYGVFRKLVQSLQKNKYGKVTVEVVPDEDERRRVLEYRREQIRKYREMEIDEIDWKPGFEYVVIRNDKEWKEYWTEERVKAEREKRQREFETFKR